MSLRVTTSLGSFDRTWEAKLFRPLVTEPHESSDTYQISLVPLHLGYLGQPQNLPYFPVRRIITLAHPGAGQIGEPSVVSYTSSSTLKANVANSEADTRVIGLPLTNSQTPFVKPPVQARIASLAPEATKLPNSSLATAGPTGN